MTAMRSTSSWNRSPAADSSGRRAVRDRLGDAHNKKFNSANSINERGMAVGTSQYPMAPIHSFLWRKTRPRRPLYVQAESPFGFKSCSEAEDHAAGWGLERRLTRLSGSGRSIKRFGRDFVLHTLHQRRDRAQHAQQRLLSF